MICTVKSTHSQSNSHSWILVETDSHADACVVGSNVLVAHNHKCYIDVYSFDQAAWHKNAYTIDATIVYKDQ